MKARVHYVESRQNKPKVNQKRWCSLFLLSLGKTQIYLVFLSLIRTSDLSVEGTSARKYKRKKYFSFVFLSLIRTFNPTDFRYSRSEKHKFIWFFSRLIVPLHNVCFLTMVKGEAFLG